MKIKVEQKPIDLELHNSLFKVLILRNLYQRKLNSYTLKFNIFKQILQIISEVGPGNMINFASLFGGFQRGANSMVNDVLDNPNANLEQLLDIESFSNEYKSGSNKINEYMKYQRFLQLIKYVTVVGPQNDQKKGYKFPMVASDILSSDNSIALQFFLPDGEISVQKQYEQTEQIDIQVNDDDEQYLTESPEKEPNNQEQTTSQVESPSQNQQSGAQRTQQKLQTEQKVQQQASPKKTKIIKQLNIVKKKKKQPVQPLFSQLMSYFKGPINYTLAGYVSKILMVFFNKKPNNFYQKLFDTSKNYIAELSNHIQSRSVGDLVLRLLTYESAIFLQKRIQFYDHLVQLLSNKQQIHVITNLAFSLHEVIQKTSTYVKTKINIQNNPTVIETYMKIFYRDGLVHKIVNNTMNEDQNISGYNSFVLHGYLHNTEIQTFHSFKLQEVLESFIKKAVQKLRNISNRKVLGVGRIKIIQIFTFLVKKQLKSLDDLQKSSKGTELSSETLQALFVHSLIAKNQDFFSILFQLTKLYEFNNILHNEVYKIVQTILKQPAAQQSALQLLILNDQDVLLKFICKQADYDSNIKRGDKKSRRKGYIGHVIKICQLINSLDYPLLNQKIKQRAQFKNVMKTLVANDEVQTSKSLAGYQMKRNPAHEIMFQKQEILKAYESFLCHSPKAEFQQPEEQHSEEQTSEQHVDISQQHHSQIDEAHKRALQKTQAELIAEQMDEQKFNQCIANAQPVDQVNPKFWMNNLQYDVDELLKEL